jgi:threonine/homoserine/homoserine lactone efflux protein
MACIVNLSDRPVKHCSSRAVEVRSTLFREAGCQSRRLETMTLHTYLLFVFASLVLALVPGPDMVYMLARCIAQGRRAGILAALGFNAGAYVHLSAAAIGLSAILAASSLAFTAVRWAGAAYLIYLGIGALRSKGGPLVIGGAGSRADRTIFWQAFWSDVLNPKVAVFFLALLPQFVDPHTTHPTLQILLLGVTVNMICLPINIVLVAFSARVTQALRHNDALSKWLQRGMGALFVGLGVRLAVEKS